MTDVFEELIDATVEHQAELDAEPGLPIYCIVGVEDIDEPTPLYFLSAHDAFAGATTTEDYFQALRGDYTWARKVHRSVIMFDRHFWPAVNPLIAVCGATGPSAIVVNAEMFNPAGIEWAKSVAAANGLEVVEQ